MITVPTSGDLRQARARAAQRWLPILDVAYGPLLALVGLSGTAVRAVSGPLRPTASRLGWRSAVEVVEAAGPPPDTTELVSPGPETSRSNTPPVAARRATPYGEFAWRGWNMLQRLQTHRVARQASMFIKTTLSRWVDHLDAAADELHDRIEEVLGHVQTNLYDDSAADSSDR